MVGQIISARFNGRQLTPGYILPSASPTVPSGFAYEEINQGFCSFRVTSCNFVVPVLSVGYRSLRLKPRNHTKQHEQNIRQIPDFIGKAVPSYHCALVRNLLLQFHYCSAFAALVLRGGGVFGDVGVALEHAADGGAQRAGADAVDDAHVGKSGEISFV